MALSRSFGEARPATFGADLARNLRDDAWFYAAVAAYVAAAGLLARHIGAERLFQPFLYVEPFLTRAGYTLLFAVVLWAVFTGIRRRPAAPFSGFLASLRQLALSARSLPPRFVAGVALFAAMSLFYGTFTSVKNMLPHLQPFRWDPVLADIDRVLHGGIDPGPALMHGTPWVLRAAVDYIYAIVWGILLIGIAFWAATSTRYAHLRTRFFATFFLSWTLLGSVAAGIFMSAGPVYYGHVTGDDDRFHAFATNTVGAAPQIQDFLWAQFASGDVALGSGISAFPSMHLAIATMVALYLFAVSRPLGVAGAFFVVAVQLGSVLLGWHYAIDGYASILVTAFFWWLTGRILPGGRNGGEPAA